MCRTTTSSGRALECGSFKCVVLCAPAGWTGAFLGDEQAAARATSSTLGNVRMIRATPCSVWANGSKLPVQSWNVALGCQLKMQSLPIDADLPRILASLEHPGTLVLVAPPGAGKTTRVAPALLDASPRRRGLILLVQPRRLAAVAAAARIAQERGGTPGEEVGYQVRFDRRRGPATRLLVVTDGVLLRLLQEDPFVTGVDAVLLDEFHERRLATDLALGLLREARGSGREDLRLAIMSATLDADDVARYLGDCPVIQTAGRAFPVEVSHLPRPPEDLRAATQQAVRELFHASSGHLLVFHPGRREIQQSFQDLRSFAAQHGAALHSLHGGLPLREQQRAIAPTSHRKILLATNLAETSLTVEGVDAVVDMGLQRVLRTDPRTGVDRLITAPISQASATQRSGRAGRLRPGVARRLWSPLQHHQLEAYERPEVLRVDLAGPLLQLKSMGISRGESFAWLSAPPPEGLAAAERLLLDLQATQKVHGPLTATGERMARIPAHPRIARILLEARRRRCGPRVALLAALLEPRDLAAFPAPESVAACDLFVHRDLLERRGTQAVDPVLARQVRRLAREYERHAGAAEGPPSEDEQLHCLLTGYPDRVARRRGRGSPRALLTGGHGVHLAPGCAVRDGELFVALSLRDRDRDGEAIVEIAGRIEAAWLEETFPDAITRRVEVTYDARRRRVTARRILRYRDLSIGEDDPKVTPDEESTRLLKAALRAELGPLLATNAALSGWIQRVRCLQEWAPEQAWPSLDEDDLVERLAPACHGRLGLDDVLREDLVALLEGGLAYEQRRCLADWAPERLRVPSGSLIALRYRSGQPPVLPVRVQELFGWHETPRVAAGRVAVVLEILGPHHRPVQTTSDLGSFWEHTYRQVRKDLRARYPRHAWPEDPWTAVAETRPRRRR